MTNFTEVCNIPETDIERLQDIEPEYSVKFGGARLLVTPAAHERYDLTPNATAISDELPPVVEGNPRCPYVVAILAAPNELEVGPRMNSTPVIPYVRNAGACTIWLQHDLLPKDFDELTVEAVAAALREEYSISEQMADDALIEQYEPQQPQWLRKNYLGGILNSLETVAFNQIMYMRESSYAATPSRAALLRQSGIRLTSFVDEEAEPAMDIITTRTVVDYARKRTQKLSQGIFNVFFEGDFNEFRQNNYDS
jgi:hypothetical protein